MKVYAIHNWDEVEYDGLVTNWIYLHGQLEKDNGYDLCWIPFLGCVPPYRTGIFKDFEIEINGEVRKVNIYVWSSKEDNEGYYGLVVYADDDDEANEYAQNAYEERSNYI